MEGYPLGDIILLALIAGFIALRLRNTLGKSSGIDPRDIIRKREERLKETVIRVPSREVKPETSSALDEAPSVLVSDSARLGIDAIRIADPAFSVPSFLDGARIAFEWVFEAFARDDRARLQSLMAEPVFALFAQELDRQRQFEGRKPEATLVSIVSQDITDAQLLGLVARITVRFVSEQIHVVRDPKGAIIEGNPSYVQRVQDNWVFERDIASRSPNWKLVDT